MKKLLSILSLAMLISCGSSDDASSTTTSQGVTLALSTASSVMAKMVPATKGISGSKVGALAAFGANYTNTDFAIGGDFGSSPKSFLQKQGDDTAQSSLMYRFRQNVQENICMFAYFLPSTAGVPDVTSAPEVISITDALIASNNGTSLAQACPEVTISNLPPRPFVVRYQVESIASLTDSQYDIKVSFDVGNSGTFGDFFYFGIDATGFKFVYNEFKDDKASSCMFEYNLVTKIGKFEYMEDDDPSFRMIYRGFIDENANIARFIARVEGDDKNDKSTIVVTTPTSSATQLAVSYSFVEDNDDTSSLIDANACVSNTTLAIVTDDTLVCTGATGLAASAATFDITSLLKANIEGIDHTFTIPFTSAADIMTEDLSI